MAKETQNVEKLIPNLNVELQAGKLASLDRSWKSNKGTYRALGMAGTHAVLVRV